MPNALVIYMVAHQPRRVRLPAQLIQRGTAPEKMDALIFDEAMDRRYFDKVAKYCYRPATELFSSLVEKGMKISLGFSVSLLEQMRRFGPDVLTGYQKLVAHPNCELSDDVGYRFSNRDWNGWPLMADTYASWVRQAMGEFVFLAWDFETFGEHHRADSGIFPFMHALHDDFVKQKMRYLTPSEAIAAFPKAHEMPLPEYGCTWAGDGGMDFFLGNEAQQGIFRLMHHIYNKAKLTKHPHLIDIAMWLLQSDNLHLIQWFSKAGAQAEVSAYFTPDEWWELGGLGILREQQRVYVNFLRAMDEYA